MSEQAPIPIADNEHYAYVTRSAIRLFNQGVLTNVVGMTVEPDYGYVTRLTYDDGSHRITYGNDLGLNLGAACDLAKDKGHSKFMLREIGINTPKGAEFLLPWWADTIEVSQNRRGNTQIRRTDMATAYIDDELGYPVYIKPVSGSKGIGVTKVDNDAETAEVFTEYNEQHVRVAVVEEAVSMPDYRFVLLDGELISAYLRKPLGVSGNGTSTVRELIEATQQQYFEEGRDTIIDPNDIRIARQLGKSNLTLNSILPDNSRFNLTPVSNLSAGGTSEDVTTNVHERWIELSAYVASNFNLRLCGVDLACSDVTDPNANYSVLEVNAAPGLDHYASSGVAQQGIVDDLYTRVLNAYPNAKKQF